MTYRSLVPEECWLDYFYAAVRMHGDRVELLRKLSDVALLHPRELDNAAIRLTARSATFLLRAEQCFCCLTAERCLYWHHIIQVQHGGSNSPRNFVRLCKACHRRVHPWLEPPTSVEQRHGWTSVVDLTRRVMDKLMVVWESAVRRKPDQDQAF